MRWRRRQRSIGWLRPVPPVFSHDDRFANVELPTRDATASDRGRLGLVSMRDGSLLAEASAANSFQAQAKPAGGALFVTAGAPARRIRFDPIAADRLDRPSTH